MEVAVVRSTLASRAVGGVSGLAKSIVGLFSGETAHDMATAGITVGRPGRCMHLFLNVGAILADEGAIHAIYACKGAGGLKPCLMCRNVYDAKNVREVVERDTTGTAVHHACADNAKLLPLTGTVLNAIFRQLAAIAALPKSKGRLEEAQTSLGWTHCPGSLLQSGAGLLNRFLPLDTCIWDSTHALFVNGVFNAHMGQLMLVG